MEALRVVLTIIFILICIALTVLVLMQEGKSAGLGSISGAAETYWGKNKGRSMEGLLVKITKILAVLIMLVAVTLNLNVILTRKKNTLVTKSVFLCGQEAIRSIHEQRDGNKGKKEKNHL